MSPIEHAPIGVTLLKDYRRHAVGLFALAAAASLVGSLLAWQRVLLPGGKVLERTALHGDGALTAAVAGTGLALALFGLFYRPGRRGMLFGMLAVSGAILWIAGTVWSRFPAGSEVGPGLWLTLAGGVVGLGTTVFFTWCLGRAPAESMERPLPILPG